MASIKGSKLGGPFSNLTIGAAGQKPMLKHQQNPHGRRKNASRGKRVRGVSHS